MENLNTVTLNVDTLAAQIIALGSDAGQIALEAVVKNHSIAEICSVDRIGQQISGSAERAVAALVNFKMFDAMEAADSRHWSKVVYKEVSDLAKVLVPVKAEFFAANKELANPSAKWARIRDMAYGLSHPKIAAPIGEGEEGAEGGEGETSRTRDLYARYVIELGKLYRAGNSSENDAVIKAHANGDKIIAALEAVTTALKALGAPLEDDDLKTFMAKHK